MVVKITMIQCFVDSMTISSWQHQSLMHSDIPVHTLVPAVYIIIFILLQISLIWCFCNIIFLFFGGIVSIIYFVENNKLWHDQCQEFASFQEVKECDDLYTVSSCQIAGGVS